MTLFFSLLLVFITGLTGLIYQVTWQKYLSIHLGSHALASTLILAVFFGFLTLGCFTVSKIGRAKFKNQFLFYGVLEGLIGFYSLVSPVYFEWLERGFSRHFENPFISFTSEVLFTCLFVGPPTWLMGGTIPALTESLSSSLHNSHRIHALIYALNTFGAFLGALVAGFYLIETLGLPGTLLATGFVNIFVFVASIYLCRNWKISKVPVEKKPDLNLKLARRKTLFVVSFIGGFYFFSFESIVIRLASLSIGSTVYTYSVVVAAFILSIALGSHLVKILPRSEKLDFVLKIYGLMMVTLIVTYMLVPTWPSLFLRIKMFFQPSLMNHIWYSLAVLITFLGTLLIPIGLMGMGLPLLYGQIRGSQEAISQMVGRLYGVNSIGCVLGALVGGYFFYFVGGIDLNFKFNLVLVAICVFLLSTHERKSKLKHLSVFAGCILIIIFLPKWNENNFVPGLYLWGVAPNASRSFQDAKTEIDKNRSGKILFTEHDPNTSVHVFEKDDKSRGLYVNGKPDAVTNSDTTVRTLTALIPTSISPSISETFIIGLGTGRSAGIVSAFKNSKSVTVAEISSGVIHASRLFAEHNFDYLKSPKVTVKNGDAYKVLRNENKLFDLIFCEPSNPWITGVEKLYSYEFLLEASKHLKPNGVYAQWFILAGISNETFLTILRTFNSVFPWTTVWNMGGALNIVGSQKPLTLDFNELERRYNDQKTKYNEIGLHHFTSILGLQLLPPASVYLSIKDHHGLHTVTNPILGYVASRGYFAVITASLNAILEDKIKVPIPDGFTSREFLIEQFPEWKRRVPEKFFQDGLSFISDPGIKFARDRLNYFYSLNYPQNFSETDRQKFKQIKTVMGLESSFTIKKGNEVKDIQELLNRYTQLKLMHLEPKISQIAKLSEEFLENCKEAECGDLKKTIAKLQEQKRP